MTARKVRTGRLVTLEGIDGAGKSTLVRALARALRARGVSVAVRREPNDPRLGRLAQSASVSDPWTGAVYFTLDRFLARPLLERDLERHEVVLMDRSFYSTLAYQGSALRPAERRRLEALQRAATRTPSEVLLVDLDPGTALKRLGLRGSGRAPLERRRTLERVARAYRALARRHHWSVLDGRRTRRALLRDALAAIGRTPRRKRPGRTPGRR